MATVIISANLIIAHSKALLQEGETFVLKITSQLNCTGKQLLPICFKYPECNAVFVLFCQRIESLLVKSYLGTVKCLEVL